MLATTFLLAFRAIRRHVLRSFLTVLGVVIGVWAVVTMVTLGNSTTEAVSNSISSLGSNLLTIRPGQGFGRGGGGPQPPSFDESDVTAIRQQIGGVAQAVPQATAQATAIRNAANWSTTVTGTTRDYLAAQQLRLADGRNFTREEEQAGKAVCIVGSTIRDRLFRGEEAVGDRFRVGDVSCEVIGVLAARGQSFGSNPDDSVIMPLKAVQRRFTGNREIGTILVALDPAFDARKVQQNITALLRERRGLADSEEDDFNILDPSQLASTLSSTITMMTALLAAVAAVSLLVGGIGIMNIMLVSVTERTREIGIRLAIGALSKEVLMQFLVEAVVLGCIGGLIGLLLAAGTVLLVSPLIQVPFRFEPGINLLAFLFSAAIGIIFGYVPARRAAALNPIDALRHE